MKNAPKALAGAAGVVAMLTLASRLMGLVRKLAQSWALSDGPAATAYDTANTVPNVLFEVAAGGALAGAVIPILTRYLARGESADADRTASALATWIIAIGLPLAVVVVLAADPIAAGLLPNATPDIRALSATLLRMFAVQVPLYGLSVVATGILHSRGHFVLPALSPLLSSLAVTAAFLGYSTLAEAFANPAELSWQAVAVLGLGTTAGVMLFSLPQLAYAARYARLRPTFRFPVGAARHTARLAAAGLGALAAQQVAIVAIMVSANAQGGVGTYAAFNYAYAIFMVPYAVLAVPIATVVFPELSAATGDKLADLTASSTRLVFAMGAVSAALLVVLAEPAKIAVDMGRDITGLDTAMRAMAGGLVGFSLLYHGARVLYARGAGARVIASNTAAWGAVVACLFAATLAGVSGRVPTLTAIGVALSVGLTIGGAVVLAMIRREVGPRATAGIARLAAVLVPVLAAGGAVAHWVVGQLFGTSIISALVAAAAGGLIVLGAGLGAIFVSDRRAWAAITRR